ncbi:MAG: cytochrome c-type biogenesis protein [Pseudomonadota bacterium]
MTERYGDFVLLAPPVKPATYLLWAGPFALFVVGAAGTLLFVRRHRTAPIETNTTLSNEERRELDGLLKGRDA